MAAMKAAKLASVEVVSLDCPYCDGEVSDPSTGSLNVTVRNLKIDTELECNQCGRRSTVPLRVWRWAQGATV